MGYYQTGYLESPEYQWEENVQQTYYSNPYYTQQPQFIDQYRPKSPEFKSKRKRNPEREEEKAIFSISLENILNKVEKRTTLMIKNIPNKYNQIMLLKKIDENHKNHYDFFYLPIDFKVSSLIIYMYK